MNIIAFLGSPRKDGNTELLLRETIKGIEDSRSTVQSFNLNLMKISPCQNCGGCDGTGICTIEDEMVQIYDAIRTADRIILASPIFFFGLSAQTKIMIDRCQAFWCEKYLLKNLFRKVNTEGRAFALVGGMKKKLALSAQKQLQRHSSEQSASPNIRH